MKQYAFARGTTLPITFIIQKVLGPGLSPVPININGFHLVMTVRSVLINGTVDSVSPPIAQLDNALLGGITLAPQPTTLPNGQSSLGVAYAVLQPSATTVLPNPTGSGVPFYYDLMAGDTGTPEGVFQCEFGRLIMTPRVTLSTP